MSSNSQEFAQKALDFARMLCQQYFESRALRELSQCLDPAVTWIGTGPGEICRNLDDAKLALSQELAEYACPMHMMEQDLTVVPRSENLCVVYGTMLAVPEDVTLAEEDVRISMVLEMQGDAIKLVHLHVSRADTNQERGHYLVTKSSKADAHCLRRILDLRGRQLDNLTKNIPGGVHQCKNDEEFSLISMSDGFLTMFGYSRQEVQQLFHNHFMQMIHPADRAATLKATQAQLALGTAVELEYRVLCKQGPPVWILDKGRLLDDGEGGTCFYCLLIEITDRKRQQEDLRLSLERHQVIMDQATDIIFEWDILEDTLDFSPNWRKKFGYNPINSKVSGRIPLSRNIFPEDVTVFLHLMQATAGGMPYSEAEFRIKNVTGLYHWCRIRATAQFDNEGRAIKAVGVITDIDAEKKHKQVLLEMAQRDALTGLYNKAATGSLVEQRIREEKKTLQALLILDVDYFKAVNDTYGHLTGDSVLSDVAATLKTRVRESDLVGRIGGDEFLVFLTEVADEAAAMRKAQKLRTALGRLSPEPGEPPITCSIGMAVLPAGTADYASMYSCADQALYHRKNIGRDGVTLYEPNLCADCPDQDMGRTAIGADVGSEEGNLDDERLARYAFRALYTARDTEATLDRLLEIIGRSFDVSRAYVFENSSDGLRCSNTFEWCAEGIEPQMATLQDISYAQLGGYLENFNENGLFYCPLANETHPGVRALLAPQGVHSMIQCAMLDEGHFVGYVGFDECREDRKWTARQVASFKTTADVLSTFLVKLRQKQERNSHS